jgi:hypothetical protein
MNGVQREECNSGEAKKRGGCKQGTIGVIVITRDQKIWEKGAAPQNGCWLLFQGLCEDFRHSNVLDYIFV